MLAGVYDGGLMLRHSRGRPLTLLNAWKQESFRNLGCEMIPSL